MVEHLKVLASAIAGRAVDVTLSDPGDRTWTDGTTIYLDRGVHRFDQLRLLGVQASLLASDSLAPDVVSQLRRHRGLARRYLAFEGHRALAESEPVLPPWMWSLVDRGRAGGLTSAADSLEKARCERTVEPDWVLGAIDAGRVTRTPSAEASMTAQHAGAIDAVDTEALATLEDDDADEQGLGNMLSSPVGGGGPIGRLLARLLRPTRSRDGAGPPGADAATHLMRGRPGAGRTVVSTRSATPLDGGDVVTSSIRSYPEWDERQQRYRVDWCTVVEDEAPASEGGSRMPDDASLRRVVARLGMGLLPVRRQKQGDDIDIDAVVEAQVDLVAGSPQDRGLYIESVRRRRDLSVLVLLDVSGSAAEPGFAGRTVHEHQRDAAAILTTALYELGDRVGLYAFHSHGRTAVHVTTVKGFDEPADGRVAGRLHGLEPGAYTRLGAAIRHGSALLEERGGTPRRLLVVVSDGFAYDHGYEGRYGEADARRALTEARRRGIGCLCLSVGADTDTAALRRVFGTAAHAAVPAVDRLPSLIGPLFAAALASAEAQRRRYQRTERTRERLELERGRR